MSDPQAPVVVVAVPGAGSAVVAAALAASPQLRRLPAQLLDELPGVPSTHHRLTASDATPERAAALEAALRRALSTHAPIRPLLSGPRLAVRTAFLAAALPQARFVVVDAHEDRASARALSSWPAGAPRLPGAPEDPREAWLGIRTTLEQDLSALPPERVLRVDRAALVRSPAESLRELAAFAGLGDEPAMAAVVAATAADRRTTPTPEAPPDAGRHSPRFARVLRGTGGALLAAVPDPGLLVIVQMRQDDGGVEAVAVPVPRLRGVAVDGDRLAVTAADLWLLQRDQADMSTFVSVGRVDAHGAVLGDPVLAAKVPGAVVEHPHPAYATARGGLLQPRWRPPAGRRRVGGVAIRDGVAAYATTHAGIVVDLESGAIVAHDLRLPGAPCWADGALWLVERETGTLCRVDVGSGRVERVAVVDGAAHGLVVGASVAFVSGLRRGEGAVWAVDLATGTGLGFATLGTGTGTATSVGLTVGVPRPRLTLSGGIPPSA